MPAHINLHLSPLARHYLAELRDWLAAGIARFRLERQFYAVAQLGVAADITADAIADSNAVAATAHAAEVNDREAITLLDSILADGALTAAELPALRRVRALAVRSAELDHDLAEHAAVLPALGSACPETSGKTLLAAQGI